MLIPDYIGSLPPAVFCPDLANMTPAGVLTGSTLFQEYQQSFVKLCGLSLCLKEPTKGRPDESPTTNPELISPVAIKVPVRVGNNVIALLQTGTLPEPVRTEGDEPIPEPPQSDPRLKLLELFACQLADWYVCRLIHAPTQATAGTDAIYRAKEWIEAHYREPLTIPAVAKKVRMNPTNFCRNFHYATGTKFRTFLGRTRVAHSLELLTDPERTIIDIAKAVGFGGVSQYNRHFRLVMGQNPTQYRLSSSGAMSLSPALVCSLVPRAPDLLAPSQ